MDVGGGGHWDGSLEFGWFDVRVTDAIQFHVHLATFAHQSSIIVLMQDLCVYVARSATAL